MSPFLVPGRKGKNVGGGVPFIVFISMEKIALTHQYSNIISIENLLEAWKEFERGKTKRKDVQEFGRHLMANVISLHHDLARKIYTHSAYEAFTISDPKPRNIHKASVRDRLVHRALYRALYPFFDKKFIHDSYSCRYLKGTHRAIQAFQKAATSASFGHTKTVWVLKCDIRKFFASIDQASLIEIVKRHIADSDTLWLIERVVESFESTGRGKGLPLGNLTSQLLVNIYMNEFDQFVKHGLKQRYYIRYADDFVFLHQEKMAILEMLPNIHNFLDERLGLTLHPDKVFVKTFASGVDFLGWVHFPTHRVLRTSTKKRMLKRLEMTSSLQTIRSYRGLLSHGNAFGLQKIVERYDDKLSVFSNPRMILKSF